MYRLALILLFVLSLPTVVRGQVFPLFGDSRTGTTGFQFLKITPDARAAGLSGTYIAIANDVSALYWNPAGITRIDTQQLHLQLGYTAYYGDIDYSFGGAVYRISDNAFIGTSLSFLNSGTMDVTTEFSPFGSGQTFRATDMAWGITYAHLLTEQFGLGLTAKYVRESIADINSHALVFDFGFQYEVGVANTRFAVGVSNFGFNTEPQGELARTGLNGKDTIQDFEGIAVPAVFRLGFAWDAVKKEEHLFTLAGQLNHPTDNNETFGIATEYIWNELVAVRAGYLFGQDQKGFPSLGFGLQYKRRSGMVRLDYGMNHQNILGVLHRISLGISVF